MVGCLGRKRHRQFKPSKKAALGRLFFACRKFTATLTTQAPMRTPFLLPTALVLGSLLFAPLLVGGCSHTASNSAPQASPNDEWHSVPLPGKALTQYSRADKQGRPAWQAVSVESASLWRKKLSVTADALRDVSFSWWVQTAPTNANLREAAHDDAPARVVFAFDGDTSKLPSRTRMMFDLAEALTGEKPPYATLMYVWDASLPAGTVLSSARTDRIRKIVVDSGPAATQGWRDHRRDLAADFKLAFGEAPGALTSVALMTDSDNTRSSAAAWFGAITLH
jgi:hypothetical protein